MDIRVANERDCDSLVALISQLGYQVDAEDIKQRLDVYSRSGLNQVLVAVDQGSIVGLAVLNTLMPLHVNGAWGVISALVVDESVRGKGIGARLLEVSDGYFRGLGCVQVELSSGAHRLEAHKFYRANGFAEKPKRFVKRYEA